MHGHIRNTQQVWSNSACWVSAVYPLSCKPLREGLTPSSPGTELCCPTSPLPKLLSLWSLHLPLPSFVSGSSQDGVLQKPSLAAFTTSSTKWMLNPTFNINKKLIVFISDLWVLSCVCVRVRISLSHPPCWVYMCVCVCSVWTLLHACCYVNKGQRKLSSALFSITFCHVLWDGVSHWFCS